jgi:hypothetical protein
MTNKLTNILQCCLATLLLVSFWGTDIAYARGGYGGGGVYVNSGSYINSGGHDGVLVSLTQESFYGLLQLLAVLILVLLPITFYREISNLIRFWDKKFTSDPELIEFIKSIHPRFTDIYSVNFFGIVKYGN